MKLITSIDQLPKNAISTTELSPLVARHFGMTIHQAGAMLSYALGRGAFDGVKLMVTTSDRGGRTWVIPGASRINTFKSSGAQRRYAILADLIVAVSQGKGNDWTPPSAPTPQPTPQPTPRGVEAASTLVYEIQPAPALTTSERLLQMQAQTVQAIRENTEAVRRLEQLWR